ncbi:hypothetical protein D3C73_1346890 [compost metagenome]
MLAGALEHPVDQQAAADEADRAHEPGQRGDDAHRLQVDAFGVDQVAGEPCHEEVEDVVVAEQRNTGD